MRIAACSTLAVTMAWTMASGAEPTRIPATALATAATLRDKAAEDTAAFDFLAGLTTEIGPRLAGSANDQRAREWTVARFKALGFDKVWTEPVTFPKWVRRSESAEIIAPFPQRLAVTALGYSPATPKGGLRGEVVAFKDFKALQAADTAAVKDKIVYVAFRMHAARDGHEYGTATAGRTLGPALAAKLGARAFVLRSAGSDSDRLPHTGVTRFDDKGPRIPAAALSNADADLLERMLAAGKPVTLKLDLDCGIDGEYTSANVIGELTGSEHPEQIVAIGGHLDSWDLGTGAIDDGAGVAIAAGAAHVVSTLPQRPKRSIRVVAFANEEAGMLGGHAYGDAHRAEVAQHVLGAESDFGAGRIWRLNSQVKPDALGAIDQMMQVLAPLGVERGDNAGAEGGDFGAMGDAGMALLGLTQDGTHYFDWHHTANDTLDKVDPKDLAQNVAVYAVFTYLAAEADGDFGSAPNAFERKKRH
ncbi:MAG TPA: M28 family peptidase [Rudaea sp.]|nr:M28 family peptidase [Rudaea sp.]